MATAARCIPVLDDHIQQMSSSSAESSLVTRGCRRRRSRHRIAMRAIPDGEVKMPRSCQDAGHASVHTRAAWKKTPRPPAQAPSWLTLDKQRPSGRAGPSTRSGAGSTWWNDYPQRLQRADGRVAYRLIGVIVSALVFDSTNASMTPRIVATVVATRPCRRGGRLVLRSFQFQRLLRRRHRRRAHGGEGREARRRGSPSFSPLWWRRSLDYLTCTSACRPRPVTPLSVAWSALDWPRGVSRRSAGVS